MRSFLMCIALTLQSLTISLADTDLWPKAHPDAPYAALKFYEKTCDCPSGLNATSTLGFCFNSTDSSLTEVPCKNNPFWGVVYTWWIGAGFLMLAATTTGWSVFRECLASFSGCAFKRKNFPLESQVGDEDIMLKIN
jgi:hypothetical protein